MNVRAVLRCCRVPLGAGVLLVALALCGQPAVAQTAPQQPAPAAPPAPETPEDYDPVTQELIELFIQRGLLTRAEADAMIARARARVAADMAQRGESGAPPPESQGTIRVVYLSEVEKTRIRDEIRRDVLVRARSEGWLKPDALPDWVQRIEVAGDVRTRYELDAFDSGNTPAIDFQAINSGPPFDISDTNQGQPPWLNTTQDRRRLRLRTRLSLDTEIASGVDVGLRLATGSIGNPVSRDQTLGSEFGSPDFLLDRAFARYVPVEGLSLTAGRAPNPFESTDLVWDPDLSFDGLSLRYTLDGAFLTVGAFATGNTLFEFPANQPTKIGSRDKWLYGAQVGTTWSLPNGSSATFASSYYYFHQIEGELSSPCETSTSSDPCDTDHSRPGFMQKGNTLFAIRDIEPQPNEPEFQYFGLASPFRELSAMARFDIAISGPVRALVEAEAVVNLAYDENEVRDRVPANNYGEQQCDSNGQNCIPPVPEHQGGNSGFLVQVLLGHLQPAARGAWNFTTGFRRLATDAVVDAFADSDFHLGGTNAKGFHVGGAWGLAENAWLSLRWLSATEVTGAPLANDVYQIDLNARF